ncbi:MAG: Fur family transcriptional regulator [Bdellovibrionota bacterium]
MKKSKDTIESGLSPEGEFLGTSLKVLRKAGCRITRSRVAVIECIAKAEQPLSAPAIYEQLSRQGDEQVSLDKASVYRILDTLSQLHLVHRVTPEGTYLACNHHSCKHSHHVLSRCTKCNDVQEVDVPSEVVAPLLFHMRHTLQFIADSDLLHLDGVCSECSAASRS